MGAPSKDQCDDFIYYLAVPVADADISGQGVILAFVLSAYITFATIALAYAFGMVEGPMLNHVDRRIFRVRPYNGNHPQIHAGIRKAVLSLSDQQIVTGIAIMGAGFEGLRTGKMTVYHFQIVLYLAWMSSSVHLSALTLLKPFLHDHLGVKAWRLCGMLVLLVLLFIGIIPTISNDWGLIAINEDKPAPKDRTAYAIPASCFWRETYGDGVNPDAMLGWVILTFSYGWKVGDLFALPPRWYRRFLRDPIDRFMEFNLLFAAKRYEQGLQKRWLWAFRLFLTIYLPVTAIFEFAASFSASLWLSALGLVFGTLQIEIPRSQNIGWTGNQENIWGFGQLIPLILLIQPVGAVTEVFWVRNRRESVANLDETDWHHPFQTRRRGGGPSDEIRHTPFIKYILSLSETNRIRTAEEQLPATSIMNMSRGDDNKPLQDYIFGSAIFKLQIIFANIGLALIAMAAFTLDALSIGYGSAENWYFVAISISGYTVASILLSMVFVPFSRLGKGYDEPKEESTETSAEYELSTVQFPNTAYQGSTSGHDDETKVPLTVHKRVDTSATTDTADTATSSNP